MSQERIRRARALGAVLLLLAVFLVPGPAAAGEPSPAADGGQPLRADLDGVPLDLGQVGFHFCEDFSSPVIHCFSKAADLEAAVQPMLAATSLNYAVIYDYTGFAGAYMYLSDDYTILAGIGWNDRISSFKGQNSMSGRFWTDWFYGGSLYSFCCNQQVTSLGSFDNTFSSVYHN